MRIDIIAVGRLGRTAEAALAGDYASRAGSAGRSLGLGPVEIIEVEARSSAKELEAKALIGQISKDGWVIACDEHGKGYSSRDFAARLAELRDGGTRRLALLIGGADGLAPDLLAQANERMAFGPQTWPHALVRVMAAEQVYRAATILAGSPYHRD